MVSCKAYTFFSYYVRIDERYFFIDYVQFPIQYSDYTTIVVNKDTLDVNGMEAVVWKN